MAKIVFIGAIPTSITTFRRNLIIKLVNEGHNVIAMAGETNEIEVKQIQSLGIQYIPYPITRNRVNPLKDCITFLHLFKSLNSIKPDIVFSYTIKPIIFGSFAITRKNNIKYIALIEGLGYGFQGKSFLRKILKLIIIFCYRFSLKDSFKIIFLNKSNRKVFIDRKIVNKNKCELINGIGIDLNKFKYTDLKYGAPIFLLISRLLKEKGIIEYVKAAKIVLKIYPDTIFQLIGDIDFSHDRIDLKDVLNWDKEGSIEYYNYVQDVRPFLINSHIYTLPSYHEGMSTTIMEAMSIGRPILTTNVPGCKETVVNGKNGFTIPPKNYQALANKMFWFIENRNKWEEMGKNSRKMAEAFFDVNIINSQLFKTMQLE